VMKRRFPSSKLGHLSDIHSNTIVRMLGGTVSSERPTRSRRGLLQRKACAHIMRWSVFCREALEDPRRVVKLQLLITEWQSLRSHKIYVAIFSSRKRITSIIKSTSRNSTRTTPIHKGPSHKSSKTDARHSTPMWVRCQWGDISLQNRRMFRALGRYRKLFKIESINRIFWLKVYALNSRAVQINCGFIIKRSSLCNVQSTTVANGDKNNQFKLIPCQHWICSISFLNAILIVFGRMEVWVLGKGSSFPFGLVEKRSALIEPDMMDYYTWLAQLTWTARFRFFKTCWSFSPGPEWDLDQRSVSPHP
jgi:hypothetical protein